MSIRPATPIHPSDAAGDSLIASLRGQAARGELDLALPARGRTIDRWRALARWGGLDLSAALGGGPRRRRRDPRGDRRTAAARNARRVGCTRRACRAASLAASLGWHLRGAKRWCSGAHLLDVALVTADASDGRRLFLVDLTVDGVTPLAGTWNAVGMADSDSGDVQFDLVIDDAAAVGGA